jgi:hypothetical protein
MPALLSKTQDTAFLTAKAPSRGSILYIRKRSVLFGRTARTALNQVFIVKTGFVLSVYSSARGFFRAESQIVSPNYGTVLSEPAVERQQE